MASALATLCGQAYGAKQYHMLGLYMQRSWIVLFVSAVLLLPLSIFATRILKLMGQSDDIAELSGYVSTLLIPHQFAYVVMFPTQSFFADSVEKHCHCMDRWSHIGASYFAKLAFIVKFPCGLIGAAMTLNLATWLPSICQCVYIICGGCPQTWTGLSIRIFEDLWPYIKLSVASGVMLWLAAHIFI